MAQGGTQTARKPREQVAADEARELLIYANGVEETGPSELARRSRVVARETLWLLDMLAAERSARRAIQQARDSLLRDLVQRGAA